MLDGIQVGCIRRNELDLNGFTHCYLCHRLQSFSPKALVGVMHRSIIEYQSQIVRQSPQKLLLHLLCCSSSPRRRRQPRWYTGSACRIRSSGLAEAQFEMLAWPWELYLSSIKFAGTDGRSFIAYTFTGEFFNYLEDLSCIMIQKAYVGLFVVQLRFLVAGFGCEMSNHDDTFLENNLYYHPRPCLEIAWPKTIFPTLQEVQADSSMFYREIGEWY